MNFLTEQEAKSKWCPMVRHPVFPDGVSGGNSAQTGFAYCSGSACMMWRDAGQRLETKITNEWVSYSPPVGWRYVVSYDDGNSKFERALSDAPLVGYCGLAGGPAQ